MSFLSVSYGPVALSNFLQAVQSPSTQVFPEHIISLAWEVIWKIQHLTEPQVSDFVAVLGWHNEDISTYAKSSTIIRVKQTALKCAYLLDDTETILDLSATLFLSWDEQVLLDSLNYLTRKGDELKARTYLMQVWSEWYPKIIKLEPIQDTKFPLLSSLSNYAFLFWHRELAHEIIQILEGSDVEITPEILFKYKKNVSSPEDFVFLTTEFQSFFVTGKSNIMSPELLTSFRDLRIIRLIISKNLMLSSQRCSLFSKRIPEKSDMILIQKMDSIILSLSYWFCLLFSLKMQKGQNILSNDSSHNLKPDK
jgi:hypothetical protein